MAKKKEGKKRRWVKKVGSQTWRRAWHVVMNRKKEWGERKWGGNCCRRRYVRGGVKVVRR